MSVTKRVIVLLCNYRLYRVGVLRNTHLELRVGMLRNTHSMFRWACYVTPIWSLPRPTAYRESVVNEVFFNHTRVHSCDCRRDSSFQSRNPWLLRKPIDRWRSSYVFVPARLFGNCIFEWPTKSFGNGIRRVWRAIQMPFEKAVLYSCP